MDEQVNDSLLNANSAFSKNVIEFVTIAHEYCKLVENCQKVSVESFVNNSLKILSLLYIKALLLPSDNINEEGFAEKFVSEGDWQFVHDKIIDKLGNREQYFDIKEPQAIEGEEEINVSLAECFADIYQATKDFTTLYNLSSEEAIWEGISECKLNFEQYWGSRLLGTMSILHGIVFGNEEFED